MSTFTRTDWGARPPKASTPLNASEVVGVALHWPAINAPIRGVEAVKKALRGWQDFHMDGHGWSDIAYQVAFDQDGNRYDLRGLGVQSAANGDRDTNHRFGAFLLIVAPGEHVTQAMVVAVRAAIAEHRRLFPRSTRIVGHQDIRPEPTSCPGPVVEALVKSGAFEPVKVAPAPLPETELSRERARLTAWRKRLGTSRPRVRAAIDAFLKGTPKR